MKGGGRGACVCVWGGGGGWGARAGCLAKEGKNVSLTIR